MANPKTYSQKPADVTREWYVIDASTMPLGRLASVVAQRLIGKHKPTYTPHTDGGDFVVVINSDQLVVTGKKETDKEYFRHSLYPGGLTRSYLGEMREKNSPFIIEEAVRRMLPKNKLARERMNRLKVYAGSEHPHAPQQPKELKEQA